MSEKLSSGVVHIIPKALRSALLALKGAHKAWEDITPIARNEWICWVISPKKEETRANHVTRAVEELRKGKRTMLLARLSASLNYSAKSLWR